MRFAPSERHCAGWTGLGSSGSTTSSNSSGSTSGSRAAQLSSAQPSVRKDYPVFFNFGTRRKRAGEPKWRGRYVGTEPCGGRVVERLGGLPARLVPTAAASSRKGLLGFSEAAEQKHTSCLQQHLCAQLLSLI